MKSRGGDPPGAGDGQCQGQGVESLHIWWQKEGGGLCWFAVAAVTNCPRPKCVVAQCWRLEAEAGSVGRVGGSRGLSLACRWLPVLWDLTRSFPCAHVSLSTFSLLIRIPSDWIRSDPRASF